MGLEGIVDTTKEGIEKSEREMGVSEETDMERQVLREKSEFSDGEGGGYSSKGVSRVTSWGNGVPGEQLSEKRY